MKKIITAVALVACAALGACSSSHSTTASQKTADAQAKAYVAKCVPSTSLGQIQLAESLSNQASRLKLEQCLGIPQSQRQAFEAAALGDAEHVQFSNKAARTQFFTVTLPDLAQQYRSK